MNVIRLAELRHEQLSVDEALSAVKDPAAGGIALFTGVVRDHDQAGESCGSPTAPTPPPRLSCGR